MDKVFEENINIYGRMIRLLVSFSLIGGVVFYSVLPVWVALVAIYPFITALIAWEPIYAVSIITGRVLTGNKIHFRELAKDI